MSNYAGYTIVEQINETRYSEVYRARQEGSAGTVIIKALKLEYHTPLEIARFKHEYDLIRRIHLEGVVKVLDVIEIGTRVALVLEDFCGISLMEALKGGFSMERFLELAVRLSEILGEIHRHNIAHRNIKPSNILLNVQEDILKITDFGIGAEFTRMNDENPNPTVMEGTLAYISPEQTGRMNCSVDYRTDLYSLGVTFYEILTGLVPFQYQDTMEIIHAHIAKVPVAPQRINPDIPAVVSDIIMKLLAKSADDRYQNSFGLAYDLRKCLTELRRTGRIESFDIARQDISQRFNLPRMLVGREAEIKVLFEAFNQAGSGYPVFMMVAGGPGIGKSSLVNEIHKPIAEKRGYYITGKYDQFRRAVPYSAIIQAFQSLIRQLLAESQHRFQDWKEKIHLALGPNGRVITDIIPEMELIIGKQPDIPDLPSEEAQNRFALVLKNFVNVFADETHPLVIFLDDLQWADNASLNLIQSLALDRGLRYFLLIGAYRDNEVTAHHPLMLALDAIRLAGRNITTVTLEALDEEEVNQIVAACLCSTMEVSRPLAEIVHAKTKGNPFFVNQFLLNLHGDRHINLDPGRGWTWNIETIRELQITENVVEILAARMSELAAEPVEFIKICACMGNRFDIETLALVTAKPMEKILSVMDIFMQEGFIIRVGDLYRFHHDRIQEAAYSLLAPEERVRTHYQIGKLVLNRSTPEQVSKRIFYIAEQLNHGRSLITDASERNHLAQLNLRAGIKAKDSTAYGAAVTYLQAGIDLLPERPWQTLYDLTYALHMEQMMCQYLARNPDEAERLFQVILTNAASKTDQAKAYNAMVILYTNMRTAKDAAILGIKGLNLLGIRVSIDIGEMAVLRELIEVKFRLRKIPLESILDLPGMQDEDKINCMDLLINTGTPAYFINPNLYAVLVLKGVILCLKHGNHPGAAVAFIALGTIIQTAFGDYALGYRIGEMALKLNDRLGNKNLAGMVYHVFAFFIQHWKEHARKNLGVYRQVYQLSLESGNFVYMGYSVSAAQDCRLLVGDNLEDILVESEKYVDLMQRVKDPFIAARYQENIQLAKALRGLTADRCSLTGPEFDEEEHLTRLRRENNTYGLCFTLLYKVKLFYFFGQYEEAYRTAAELDKYIKAHISTLLVAEHYFYYSMSMAALLRLKSGPEHLVYKALILRNQRRMRTWAQLAPDNFRHKYNLVAAEVMVAKGRYHEAQMLYHAAIQGAMQNQYLHEEALACERLGALYHENEATDEARVLLQRAYQRYRAWGAMAKENEILSRYPDLIRHETNNRPSDTRRDITSTDSDSRLLDLSTVMQVSQVISSEIMLDRLLQKIMHMSVTNAGAERGYLILESDGNLRVEASEDVETGENRVLQSVSLEQCDGLSHAIVNYVSRGLEPLILDNAMAEGAFMNDPHVVQGHCKSILCTPILNKGKLSGLLYMENNLTAGAFTPERLEILHIIASQAAISLENAKLFDLATTDGLTKLFVHRYFQLMLEQEIQHARRYNRPFSLIMIDIDDFKRFNDTYGHQLGDEVLRSVGRAIRKIMRIVDISARYGGEEFVIILPETDVNKGLIAADKIRKCIEEIEIPHEAEKLHVTVSMGLAVFPYHAQDKDDLIKSADTALYVSKSEGKNRVTVGKKIDK